MATFIPPDLATRAIAADPEMDAVAASCAAAIDKLLALSIGGACGELSAKSAATLAADVARELEAQQIRLLAR
jgi:hypothetical protein